MDIDSEPTGNWQKTILCQPFCCYNALWQWWQQCKSEALSYGFRTDL